MRFRIEAKNNDGMAEAPPYEDEFKDWDALIFAVREELDTLESIGGVVTIERIG